MSTIKKNIGNRQIVWVPGHAERKKEQSQWTEHEWGNILADMTAGYKVRDNKYSDIHAPNHKIKHFMHGLEDYLRSIIPPGTWYWSNADGVPSFLGG